MRIGTGYDVHRLVEGRRCIIGGVDIPFEKGLDGHSDADVLLHAIMDALLGAAALGDIGKWFPDTDPAWEGADSVKLLQSVGDILAEHHYLIENIDATVIAQAQGNDRGTSRFHRQGRGNFRTGGSSSYKSERPCRHVF